MAEEWQGVPASSGTMDLSFGDGGGGSGSQRLNPHRGPTLVPHTDPGGPASGCNRSGSTIFSSLSAYTDRRNRSAQVPIHGRGSGLSGFTGKPKCKGCVGTFCKRCRGTLHLKTCSTPRWDTVNPEDIVKLETRQCRVSTLGLFTVTKTSFTTEGTEDHGGGPRFTTHDTNFREADICAGLQST